MQNLKRKSSDLDTVSNEKSLANELERLNIMMEDVKISKVKRQRICEIITEVTKFRMECISLTCSLLGLIRAINFSIEHIEHTKQQKIYQELMTKLCEKDILIEIDSLVTFKIILQEDAETEYMNIRNAVNECTVLLTSISQTFAAIKNQYETDKDITKITPMMKQLDKLLTTLQDIVLI